MEWATIRRERREFEKKQRAEKLRAEGRREVIEELKASGVDVSKIESKPQE